MPALEKLVQSWGLQLFSVLNCKVKDVGRKLWRLSWKYSPFLAQSSGRLGCPSKINPKSVRTWLYICALPIHFNVLENFPLCFALVYNSEYCGMEKNTEQILMIAVRWDEFYHLVSFRNTLQCL